MEKWKDIIGYEGLYKISNLGRVKSLDRFVNCKNGKHAVKKGKYLCPNIKKTGYLEVVLSSNNHQASFLIHRLVATHFISNPKGLPEVNHINEVKTDNRVNNLEWCTSAYNTNYGCRNTNISIATLQNRGRKVLQMNLRGELLMEFVSPIVAAKKTGLRNTDIWTCANKNSKDNKNHTSGGFIWRFNDCDV